MLKKKRLWLGFAVSALFFYLLLRQVDLSEMGQALQRADYRSLAPAVALYFLALAFRALRWRYLLHHLKPIAFGPLYRILAIGYMANNLLPVRLGELVRSYLLGEREHLSKTSVLGTVAIERVLDGLVLVLLLALAALGVALSPLLADLARGAAFVFGGAFAGLILVVLFPRQALAAADVALRVVPGRWRGQAQSLVYLLVQGFQVLRSPRMAALSLLLTLPVWLCEAATAYIIAQGFHLDVSPAAILIATATANLAISIPSSQGGIGPFEFFTAQTVILVGVVPEAAAAYAVVLHATLLLPVTFLGLALLWREGISLGAALRGSPLQPQRDAPGMASPRDASGHDQAR